MDQLPPEAQAVIDAARRADERGSTSDFEKLHLAIKAFEMTLPTPPAPFKCLASRNPVDIAGVGDPEGLQCVYPLDHPLHRVGSPEIWEVELTPIRRVQ